MNKCEFYKTLATAAFALVVVLSPTESNYIANPDLVIKKPFTIAEPAGPPGLPPLEEVEKELAKRKAEEEKKKLAAAKKVVKKTQKTGGAQYTLSKFRKMGVIMWGGHRWTYYSEKVLPGKGLKIPGRHVDSAGFVCDGNGYICLASCDYSKGTVLSTPFGRKGKVYDYCPTSGTVDVYIH